MPQMRAPANRTASGSYGSPVKTLHMPLNDDKEEKAKRLQSRQALHSKQIDQLKAAATPQRKRKSMGLDDPATPSQDDGVYGVRGEHVTPMKRVPILANFEEWMKMATDNKINATNSWNFALIDYFHDMSLLKEGDGVNFQKASCTLDGCVKIYTSRVDSVATETGKLLSGLADSGNKKRKNDEAEGDAGEEGDDDEENEDGTKKKGRKKAQRSAEATLVNSFDQLRLKKMELEFSVDPLFKKASADFDEGGAKGLLLNHLAIDSTGRIVFDSSDDAQDEDIESSRRDSMEPEGEADAKEAEAEPIPTDAPIDIAELGARFFPDLMRLDEQDICPSLKTFELGASDAELDLPFLKAPENWRDEQQDPHTNSDGNEQPNSQDGTVAFGMDDDDVDLGGFDLPPDTGFGEGGEVWARNASLHPQTQVYDASASADGDDAGGEVGVFDTNANTYGVRLQHRSENDEENILNYFDNALQKNWAGPEHWKIARIKEANKPQPQRVRKEKEPFEIDFLAPMSQDLANLLYTTASNNTTISLPRNQWRSKTRNLLPDDKHFNSKDLLKLFLNPKAKLGSRKPGSSSKQQVSHADADVDEAYWATHNSEPITSDGDAVHGDYDANFFQDDGLPMAGGTMDDDDDEFADAREHFSPAMDDVDAASRPIGEGIDSVAGPQEPGAGGDAFGANLVAQSRRLRPEYVQYARVAKKVDVRRLKEEMWRGAGFELSIDTPKSETAQPAPVLATDDHSTLKFTDMMNNLQHIYPKNQMADISTSFGFIALLHLANEKGLVIENVEGWQDLTVRKDMNAQILVGGD